MNFCSSCGHEVELRTPPGDTRRRFVWGICYTIPIPIVVSIVAETLSLAAVGAAAGALAIWTIIDNEFFVVGGAYGVLVLRLSVDGALCVAGLGWSLAIGAIGASVPAGRAVYMNVAATLREA